MSDVTELRFWPSCLDAIDWSHDGIIALASEENVELLFPNTEFYDTEQENTSWQHTPLQVPWFTNEEFPTKEPAPMSSYSIGEEISPNLPVGIAWSPPGLAKHRRCALGALTSSLVLSIWSADGKPQLASSWGRRLIVNDALTEYFSSNGVHEESHLVSAKEDLMRFRSRIRAFSWAFPLPNAKPFGIFGTQLTWGQHLIAIANDDNQVVFTVVDSPTTTHGADEEWSAEVLNHFSITPDAGSVFSEPALFDDIMQQQRFISHVAWSPWVVRGDWYHSVLAYATNEDVRGRIITYTYDTIGVGEEIIYFKLNLRHNGSLKWSPKIIDDHKLTLAVFSSSGVTCLTISVTDATVSESPSHNLDGRWDEISGAVWDHAQNNQSRLHFSHLNSTLSYATALLEKSETGLSVLPSPNWREQINDTQALFSAQNELKGHAKSKVWGMSISPLGDFVATCVTVHPSDMIEYGPPATRRSTVAIHGLQNYNLASLQFPAKDISAEGFVFTVKKWLDNTVEDTDHLPRFMENILAKMMQTYSSTDFIIGSDSSSTTSYDHGDINQLVNTFKRIAFLDKVSVKDRYDILISQICTPTTPKDLEKTLIAYRLANAVQNLPIEISRATPFSSEILSAHQQVVVLINSLLGETNSDGQQDGLPAPAVSVVGADTCDFCQAPIPLTDLNTAECLNGHKFPRCGLSFLAIQAPRITKYCGICNKSFLSEEFVTAQEVGSREANKKRDVGPKGVPRVRESAAANGPKEGAGEGTAAVQPQQDSSLVEIGREVQRENGPGEEGLRELPISLARVIFLSCDVCIYCGGKFFS